MKLLVNGEKKVLDCKNIALFEFLTMQNICFHYVAVAVNLKFIPQNEYKNFELKEGDDIEILSPMQGG